MIRRSAKSLVTGVAVIVSLSLAAACTASQPTRDESSGSAEAGDPEKADLTYWFWAESDAPGADEWMRERVAEYEELHPGVTIDLVPQATDTLIGSFTAAAQTKSGPDIATQWATIPVLSQAWAGALVPISDYVAEEDMADWIGTQENMDQGKLWGMPLYLLGIPLAYNKTMFEKAGVPGPPETFEDLLKACATLRQAGITPIGMGNKDGFFGAWFFSNFAKQTLDSTDELKQAVIGEEDITDPKYSGYLEAMHELVSNECLNDDIASLTLQQGFEVFGNGDAAMAWGPDGVVRSWAETLGEETIGVTRTPRWGEGELADVYNTTQSASAIITSWSEHPEAAAQFLVWLHEPENLSSWYEATGVFPADKGFDPNTIETELAQQLWDFNSSPGAVWLENYLPPAVDADGNLAAGQVITSGGSVSEAVAVLEAAAEKWRKGSPADFESYSAWAGQ